ncbi:hypothetical protein FACS189428_7570 [Clostridia bacterium]|nr:hypothetical protein FACS189428_7570 [Clostridia bacterium]
MLDQTEKKVKQIGKGGEGYAQLNRFSNALAFLWFVFKISEVCFLGYPSFQLMSAILGPNNWGFFILLGIAEAIILYGLYELFKALIEGPKYLRSPKEESSKEKKSDMVM